MERLDIIKERKEHLDNYLGSVDSNDKLLTRYLDLGRQLGKTYTLLKMLKPKGKYILVLWRKDNLQYILYSLRYNQLMTQEEISELRNNIVVFCPYVYGNSMFDLTVKDKLIEFQKMFDGYEVLVDNAVIDKETMLMNEKISKLIIKR